MTGTFAVLDLFHAKFLLAAGLLASIYIVAVITIELCKYPVCHNR